MAAPKKSSKKAPKKSAGRPRLTFDLKQVEQLAAIQCTDGEIASVLGCSRQTVLNRKGDDSDFLAAIKRGRESGKASIRRMQWQAAKKGNPTMLIWLGKQYLGQSDKRELSGPDGGPVVEIPDPSTLSLEEITAYHEKLNKRVAKVVVAGLRREEEEAEQEPGGKTGEEVRPALPGHRRAHPRVPRPAARR